MLYPVAEFMVVFRLQILYSVYDTFRATQVSRPADQKCEGAAEGKGGYSRPRVPSLWGDRQTVQSSPSSYLLAAAIRGQAVHNLLMRARMRSNFQNARIRLKIENRRGVCVLRTSPMKSEKHRSKRAENIRNLQ